MGRGMMHGQVVMRAVLLSGAVVYAAGMAMAQPIFRAAPTFPLTGTISDATPLFALADVGSLDGPLDGVLDVVTVGQNQVANVLFGSGDGQFFAGPTTPL